MAWLAEMLQRGGPQALTVLSLSGPALVVSVIHALRPRRWAWWTGVVMVALMLLVGLLGYVQARSAVDHAVDRMRADGTPAPALRRMRDAGEAEALVPLQFAGVLALPCAVALLIGRSRRQR